MSSTDSFSCRSTLSVGDKTYQYFSLKIAEKNGLSNIGKLPFASRIILENLLRNEDGTTVTRGDLDAFSVWVETGSNRKEIAFRPARVLLQDFTGVPAIADFSAMRDATKELGADISKINPLIPVDMVVDHSVIVDYSSSPLAYGKNIEREYERNQERYEFLRWGQSSFSNFRLVPPGSGICHQVNLEHLAKTVWTAPSEEDPNVEVAYPDTIVGADSHTTMVNGLSVLGWGVGGIEAEAAMLGQPISVLIPDVVGFYMEGALGEGVTATDLVLSVTKMLREKGVVEKIVEFYGPGLKSLTLEDRATISNMAPEYGATSGFFPTDAETIRYLDQTGRDRQQVQLVEAYCKAQGLFYDDQAPAPVYSDSLKLDLASVTPSLAGPKRPQDLVPLTDVTESYSTFLRDSFTGLDQAVSFPVEGQDYELQHGHVLIAAITSCTNTSNPNVMIAAGLVAKKAVELGLSVPPWVKTSLAPGSRVVQKYLDKSGLGHFLDGLGFQIVGFGCTTCIGNSGPLAPEIEKCVIDNGIVGGAVLSGNRNFEGRVSPYARANYLASPPLVVAYALAGSLNINLTTDPIGNDKNGNPVMLSDIWPSNREIAEITRANINRELFDDSYRSIFEGDENWQSIKTAKGQTYDWKPSSSYVRKPPYFDEMTREVPAVGDITGARILGLFGDSITTDHISPAGGIMSASPAGEYLTSLGIERKDFNQYGTRRGNHEVMVRGTFANIRLKNQITPGKEGSHTKHFPSNDELSIFDAAMRYRSEGVPLVVFAGKNYGTGSSRDWAAKGPFLLGVKAVIAESFERIHRSNLIGMGIIPLVYADGAQANGSQAGSWQSLGLDGSETVSISGIDSLMPGDDTEALIQRTNGERITVRLHSRIDTENELLYFRNGGILNYVLRQIAAPA